ncbi:MAG: peptidoglycan DD-metalloendopeptidase family protein [Anaerocolumna sp.]
MPFTNPGVLEVYKRDRENQKRIHGASTRERTKVGGGLVPLCLVFLCTILLIGNTLNRIYVDMAIEQIKREGINYEYFREMLIPIDEVNSPAIIDNTENINSKNKNPFDQYDYLALHILLKQNGYAGAFSILPSNQTRLLKKMYQNTSFQELKGYLQAILEDVKKFPIDYALMKKEEVTYIDSWNYLRSYGGKRKHEGTDLMSTENVPDRIEVVSMTDGTVEKMGWLEKGGYRIGIRGSKGAYYYYAHLSSYAPQVQIGDTVKAGDLLGLMGDSGYGVEGTTGMFPVHLHVGIYVETPYGERSVNPYLILKMIENTEK